MDWKNLFYFQKGDRIAICISLCLIVILGGLLMFSKPRKESNSAIKTNEEFDQFLSQLKNTDSIDTNHKKAYNRNNNYTYIPKLSKGETIEINNADTTQLKRIPGIGTSYANRIIKYRNLLGGFTSLDQLNEVWGVDIELFNKIRPYLSINPSVSKIKINSASIKELVKHPYLNYEQAKVIADMRDRKGKIESTNRLSLLDEFTQQDLMRLTPYLEFD
ncbi:helix-hairpin-helix domain-containing protein [Dysgonomonas sp. Marseille-P4361]|uniref:helix-hairpin-helix domain-containing protein n=1 Tax=Dysgonomonas sp. Marseille-P4361 TaxID=2161820 RepID=UPI000D55CCD1|nr:helix-hairpin-helix domain-containing protein [Dysgonomonas sp. Marseille-P4361]